MPRDFFGKGKGGPPPESEELEKEAAREIERLTSRERQAPSFGGGAAYGGGMGVGGLGGGSPLEAMAAQMAERRNPRRRRRGMASLEEDRAGFKGGGFIGAAANTGSVGSALGFGGGVGPGGRKKPPPPDALPLGYRPPEDYGQGSGGDAAGDDGDDDIGVTEMALRDHAERFGRGMEETMMRRSDPAEAENMREQAMRQFMERQSGRPAPVRPPSGPVNIRRGGGGRLRLPDHDESPPAAEDGEGEGAGVDLRPAAAPPPSIEVSDNEQIRIAEERARVAEDRARVAEERAQIAEERARLAEERSAYAEARAWQAARQASEAMEQFAELEAVVEELSKQPPAPEPARAKARRGTAKKRATKPAAPAKATKAEKAVTAVPAKAAAPPKPEKAAPAKAPNAVKKKTVVRKAEAAPRPQEPAAAPSSPRVGGVLGRRLAEAAQRVEQETAKAPPTAPAAPPPAAAKASPARKAPGAVKKRPARS